MAERNFIYAEALAHITADEVPDVMRTLNVRDQVARVVAENGTDDAATILDVPTDVVGAIFAYAKPRWPALF